jgi:hypothetical protein
MGIIIISSPSLMVILVLSSTAKRSSLFPKDGGFWNDDGVLKLNWQCLGPWLKATSGSFDVW